MKALAILAFVAALIFGYLCCEIDKDLHQLSQTIKPKQLDYQAYTPEEK
jgi:hypothetical protein